MKALKLILVFAVLLGGVVGALWLTGGSSDDQLPALSDNTLSDYSNMIHQGWEAAGDWDESLFNRNCELISQLSRDYETTPLSNLNTTCAVECVYNRLFALWASPSCQKSKVDDYIHAVSVIEAKDPGAARNPNVEQIKEVYAVYNQAWNLAHRAIGLSPDFDGRRWNSYDSYRSRMMSQRDAMLANVTYKSHLSRIEDIADGLANYPANLDYGRRRFYAKLAGEIKEHFGQTPPAERTKDQLQELRAVYADYSSQWRSLSDDNGMGGFLVEFNNDVMQNEVLNGSNSAY